MKLETKKKKMNVKDDVQSDLDDSNSGKITVIEPYKERCVNRKMINASQLAWMNIKKSS